jgi:hypothetical protein
MSRSIREIPIGEHTDPDILALLAELEHAAGVDTSSVKSQPFIPFLMLAVHPQGGGTKREPLHPSRTHPGFLETRIGRIESAEIQALCRELAAVIEQPLEMYINRKLMTFLNLVIRTLEKKARRRSSGRAL